MDYPSTGYSNSPNSGPHAAAPAAGLGLGEALQRVEREDGGGVAAPAQESRRDDGSARQEQRHAPNRTHREYREDGYQVAPIIPPGAELSPNTSIQRDDVGKIPGRLGQNGWAGFDWLRKSRKPTKKALEQWTKTGAGVGFVCGEPGGVVGIDIDVLDEDAAGLVQQVAEQTLGGAPVRVGRWPKRLLVYGVDVLSEPVQTSKIAFRSGAEGTRKHLIEIRGQGQQFVAQGIHPNTRQPYTWDRPVPPRDELVQVDAGQVCELVDALVEALEEAGWEVQQGGGKGRSAAARAKVDQDALAADDLDMMDEAVAAIRNTTARFPDRDAYIRVANAIKAAYRDDPARGEAAWLDWCARWEDPPEGDGNEPDKALSDYRRCRPPFEIGAPYLYQLAREDGFNDAARVFPDAPPEPASDGNADSAPSGTDNQTDDQRRWNQALQYMLGDYVYVEDVERFVCLSESYRRLLTPKTLDIRMTKLGLGSVGASKNRGSVQFHEHDGTLVKSATYRPEDHRNVVDEGLMGPAVNLWRPGELTQEQAAAMTVSGDDVRPWLELVEHIVPDDDERRTVLDWLAWCVQNPGAKPSWHLVLGGRPGCGKDTILQPVIRALGRHNVAQLQAHELQQPWTDFLEGTALVVVQEMNSFERKAVMDRLKPLLARPPEEVRINAKNQRQYTLPNITAWVFLTNHENAIAIETGDRRFFVVWSDFSKPNWPEERFGELYRWMEQEGGWRSVAAWLTQRELSEGFNAKGAAPHTTAKAHMQTMTEPALKQDIREILSNQEGPAGYHRDLIAPAELRQYLQREHGYPSHLTTPNKVTSVLRELGGRKLGQFWYGSNARAVMWAVSNVEHWQKQVADGVNPARVYFDEVEARNESVIKAKFGGGALDD
ncbi:DUF5906 domain-containing protein [Halorhodospira sp. 9621]|uniref:DUF5906 domain-containing protein n=1 Tax=Halorhodospira sp. 9621 TaxID=2899135 RepID=UPI001EE7A0BB|nr:DUF5906 domain-containing protein [Halorhodospira sp. 9621]MCG5532363.1 DUF5906 domain-containing protein [Halorhodospira sp. 9621]